MKSKKEISRITFEIMSFVITAVITIPLGIFIESTFFPDFNNFKSFMLTIVFYLIGSTIVEYILKKHFITIRVTDSQS